MDEAPFISQVRDLLHRIAVNLEAMAQELDRLEKAPCSEQARHWSPERGVKMDRSLWALAAATDLLADAMQTGGLVPPA